MNDDAPIVVSALKSLGNGVWGCDVTTPDGTKHRVVIPESITSVHGVQLTAAVIGELYSTGLLKKRVRLPNAG